MQTAELVSEKRSYQDKPTYRQGLVGLPNQIAGNSFYYINYPFPKCEDYFLDDNKRLRYCDRYYPHADGGALWMDIQASQRDDRNFDLKKKVLKEMGLRYLAIKKDMGIVECYEAMT